MPLTNPTPGVGLPALRLAPGRSPTFVAERRYRGRIPCLHAREEPTMQRHPSNKAKSGPPPERPPSPTPPPPPRWRSWLLPIGLLLSLVLLLLPNQMEQGRVTDLTYAPGLKDKIRDGQVQSVEIGSDGHIEGKLKDGTRFESSYPTNLEDPEFTKLLDDHNVQVKAV